MTGWQPVGPQPGRIHNLNGHLFVETLHGPMVLAPCIDCGASVGLVVDERAIKPASPANQAPTDEPRCPTCYREHHDAHTLILPRRVCDTPGPHWGRPQLYPGGWRCRGCAPGGPHPRPDVIGILTWRTADGDEAVAFVGADGDARPIVDANEHARALIDLDARQQWAAARRRGIEVKWEQWASPATG